MSKTLRHGNLHGGLLHSTATTSQHGFLSTTDKTKLDSITVYQNNYTATKDPTVNDDNTSGYEIASRWINTSTDEEFVCLDASTGAAVWVSTTNTTPAAHASTHTTGQTDEIDGDKIDIDWEPTNYTPATTPTEVDNVDNLTAHLYGIDQALGSPGGSGDVVGPASATDNAIARFDTTTGKLIQNSGVTIDDSEVIDGNWQSVYRVLDISGGNSNSTTWVPIAAVAYSNASGADDWMVIVSFKWYKTAIGDGLQWRVLRNAADATGTSGTELVNAHTPYPTATSTWHVQSYMGTFNQATTSTKYVVAQIRRSSGTGIVYGDDCHIVVQRVSF